MLSNTVDSLVLGQEKLSERQDSLSKTVDSLALSQDNLSKTVDSLVLGQEKLSERQDSLSKTVDSLARGQDSLSKTVDSLVTRVDQFGEFAKEQKSLAIRVDQLGEFAKEQKSLNKRFETFMVETSRKLDGIRDDVALVRGGHAVSAMHRNAALIADDIDCQLISEMPQGAIIALSRVAKANGEARNDVESFRHADMVMHVENGRNQPSYIAVEASFTVNSDDVRRAARNAEYLRLYTGLPAYAVVAGVEVLPEAQEEIDRGDAYLWRIRPKYLQAE